MLAALFVAFTLGRFFRFPARTFSGFLFSAGNPFLLCLLGGKTGFLCALLFLDAAGLGLFGFALGLFRRLAFGFGLRSEEHTSELQSLMRISYAVFCLKKQNHKINTQ